jgi:hypothetical protein
MGWALSEAGAWPEGARDADHAYQYEYRPERHERILEVIQGLS